MVVASVNWKLQPIATAGSYREHFESLVSQAVDAGADLVVFPELTSLELLFLAPEMAEEDVPRLLAERWGELPDVGALAQHHGITIVGGSDLKTTPRGIQNVCRVGLPDGSLLESSKVNLTTYEKEVWGLSPGSGVRAIQQPPIGVTICYDSEFPASGRAIADSGALVQCVPAFTETVRGFQRVRWCCQARATENQVFVVHSSLVGSLGREPVPSTFGSSAILAPSIEPFPSSAILCETAFSEEAIAVAELDFEMLLEARANGDVRNWQDRDSGDYSVLP